MVKKIKNYDFFQVSPKKVLIIDGEKDKKYFLILEGEKDKKYFFILEGEIIKNIFSSLVIC